MHLGKCFLKKWCPPCTFARWECSPWSMATTPIYGGKLIINIDSIPTIFDPEVKSIGTVFVNFLVPKNLLYSFWLFSHSWHCSEEPTVTKLMLLESSCNRLSKLTKELWIFVELTSIELSHIFGSHPGETFRSLVRSLFSSPLIIPIKRGLISWETWIMPFRWSFLRVHESFPRVWVWVLQSREAWCTGLFLVIHSWYLN